MVDVIDSLQWLQVSEMIRRGWLNLFDTKKLIQEFYRRKLQTELMQFNYQLSST